jgi:cytochrome c oxidase assembly protein subunit 15
MQLTGQRKPLGLLALVATLQVALGIATLLLHVPVTLAAGHQGVALLLLSVMLYVIFICWHQGAPLKRARLGSR